MAQFESLENHAEIIENEAAIAAEQVEETLENGEEVDGDDEVDSEEEAEETEATEEEEA